VRKLTAKAARQMASARKTFAGGRPAVPSECPKCHAPCASVRQALAHCVQGVNMGLTDEDKKWFAAQLERFTESLGARFAEFRKRPDTKF
jgi:hypothetical protein